jgi:Trehalose utilisation
MSSSEQLSNRREFLNRTGSTMIAGSIVAASDHDAAHAEIARSDFDPAKIPDWVRGVTTMAFGGWGDIELLAKAGVQVLHTNLVWPYYPLRKDGGGLKGKEAAEMKRLVDSVHRQGAKLSLGLPPFPPVELVRKHPDWRVHPDAKGSVLKVEPKVDNLATRIGCNLGPWGDYLMEVCAELVRDYGVDAYSFDGNYHPAICYCPSCVSAYRKEQRRTLPAKVDLDDVAYRRYLVWRGEKLEDHYRRLRKRLQQENPNAVLMTWTVNAGRYGHFLYSPRAMPTRLNRLIDLPMQEWWLDETNVGASVAPAFGAAYLYATTGGRPCASEPYLMSRGNPYGTHSFPKHERLVRTLLAVTHGNVTAQSFGWPGHRESTRDVCREVNRRAPWLTRAEALPWGAILVSEQTRQFCAYRDIKEHFLPHVFGAFRAGLEEHLNLRLVNDWDVTLDELKKYQVLVLPNAAALSDAQVAAIREFVRAGGGLVAIGESSLCDELGRPRKNFALSDVFGVSFKGRPVPKPGKKPQLDANFAHHLGPEYWTKRVGLATLTWKSHDIVRDKQLRDLVPTNSVIFRGPQVIVSDPQNPAEVVWRMQPEGNHQPPLPSAVAREFGKGKVVYLAAALDAALWSYSFPYQRRLLARCIEWAAAMPFDIHVEAPMCVQATFYHQRKAGKRRTVIHFFNGINTSGGHGLPAAEVPLREETVPISGIVVRFDGKLPKRCRFEPSGIALPIRARRITLPPLAVHGMLVVEA